MYTNYLMVKTTKNGEGTFTTTKIPANVPVTEIRGTLYTESAIPATIPASYLQIGPSTYLGPSGGTVDYLNHSCNPNCMVHVVGNRVILYSLYVIPAEAELTFDYSTTSTDTPGTWQMECQCGQYNCRKVISGFYHLNPDLQQKMIQKNLVPLYISQPQMFK